MTQTIEHLDVLIVGAGLSGIGAAHHVQTDTPWASYAIFEARDVIGGTWDLFRYPGIRSDSDMHTLGYPFRPWSGEKTIADGASILQYINDTATEAGIDRHIRFHHRILSADWSTTEARWHVHAERTDTSERLELTCSFLFSCSGYYRYDRGYVPDFPGLASYTGQVVQPQAWPEDLEYAGKRVVVIGSGATAVTLAPSLARAAAHVTMLQRSPTYMTWVPTKSPIAGALRAVLPRQQAGDALKWIHALGTQASYEVSRKRPEMMKKVLREGVKRQLPKGYDIDTHFTPRYNPWDQRLCAVADGDLFKAIGKGTVEMVTDTIDTFTETGLRLTSGREITADIVVPATGLELLFIGGITLLVDGEEVEIANTLTYKGMMLQDVPNFAMAVGYTNASWTLKADITSDSVCRLLNAMRERGMRQVTPRNNDAGMSAEPLLGLSSGYIQRATDRFPKQGSKFPWQVRQNYLHDYRSMKLREVLDEGLEVSNPAPGGIDNVPRRVAAITGAGSGIGRALAVNLAQEGTHLALSDLDEIGLADTVNLCEGHGVKVTSQRLDVANREAVFAWADDVVEQHGRVDLVINNAGVAVASTVEHTSYDDFEWLMSINFWGVVHGTKAFLPHLLAQNSGHIVNLSSVFGLVSVPTQAAYNAAKFGVRGFTDTLRMELEIGGSGVSCTTVHPGGIKTNIARNARMDESVAGFTPNGRDPRAAFDKAALTSPEKAAKKILAAVDANRRRVLVGPDAKVIDALSRVPGLYHRIIVRGAGSTR